MDGGRSQNCLCRYLYVRRRKNIERGEVRERRRRRRRRQTDRQTDR
jgi:hypothetical protein